MEKMKLIHMYIQELLISRMQHLKRNIKRIEDGHEIGVSLEETTDSFVLGGVAGLLLGIFFMGR